MVHPVILNCIKRGLLESIEAFDANARTVTVYRPTPEAAHYFGGYGTVLPIDNVVDIRAVKP